MNTSPSSHLRRRRIWVVVCAICSLAFELAPLGAATFTWDGGGANSNWGTANNWNPNGAPAAGTLNDYVFAGTTQTTNTANGVIAWEVNSITFNSGAGAFVISGTQLKLRAGGVTSNAASLQTINNAIALQATATFNANTGSLAMGGVISGAFGLTKTGANTLTLSGASTFTGPIAVNAGTLKAGVVSVANTSGAFGNNAAITMANVAGATLDITGFNTQIGSLTGGGATGGNVTLGTATLTIGGNSTSPAAYDGVISGTGGITKIGTGTLTLTRGSSYTGATTVSAGVLNIRNATATGTTAGGISVAGGAAREIQGGIAVGAEALTLNGTGVSSGGALRSISGANSYAGAITLGSSGVRVNSDTAATALTLTGGVTGTGFALTVGGAGDTTFNTTGINTGAAGTLTKDGSGTLTINAASNYTGLTTINNGIVKIGNATALGSATNASVTFGPSASASTKLQLNNISLTLVGLNTDATPGTPVVENGTAGAATLTVNNAGANTFAGTLADGAAGTLALTKGAAGTLTLTGANTYTGATTVSAGVLNIQNATALGTTAGATAVTSGAALELQGGIAVGAEALTLNGTGVSAGGALRSISGANSYAGAITLGSSGVRINSDTASTALTLTGGITGTGNALTIGGTGDTTLNTNGVNTSTGGTLTKDGTGKLTLNAASDYTGTTTVSAGVLNIQNATALGTTAGATAVTSGAALELQGGIAVGAEALTLNGTGVSAGGALRSVSGTNSYAGAVTLGSSGVRINSDANTLTLTGGVTGTNTNLTIGGAGDTTLNSAGLTTGSGTLTKDGTGKLTITAGGTYTGATTVSAGVLNIQNADALGNASNAASTTVANGASLQIAGNITTTNAGTLVLNGNGSGSGALESVSGNNAWNSDLTISSNASIFSSTSGNTLTLGNASGTSLFTLGSNTVTIDGAGDTFINSNVGVSGDTGGLIKNGTGKLTFYGYNSYYTGATTVNAGSMDLLVGPFNPGIYGINGSLTVGTGAGAVGSVNVNIATNSFVNQLSPTSAVTINSDGALNVGASTGMGALTLNGGQVNITAGVNIAPTGNITANTNSAHQTALISGGQTTLAAPTTFTVARDATITSDLTVSSVLAGTSLVKQGAGVLTLSGTNTYTGATTVNAGVLSVGTIGNGGVAGNLGAATNAATNLVLGGGTLQYTGSTDSTDRNFTLTTGTTSTIDVSTAATNLTISGASTNTTGGLTKAGAGTLTLSGANLYTGATKVNDGTLSLNNSAASNAVSSTTVTIGDSIGAANSATLLLSQSNQIADTAAVTVNSDGRFDVNGKSETIGSIAGSGSILLGTGQLIAGGDNSSTIYSGTLAGGAASSLTKAGSGTLTINSNLNASPGDFAGTLNVNAGGLAFNINNAFTGTVNIAAGTSLTLTNTALNIASLNFTGTGTVDLYFNGSASSLSVTNLNIAAGVTLSIHNWADAVDYFFATNWTGAVQDLTGTTPMNQVNFNAPWTGSNTKWQSYDNQITPVPEPSTYGVLLIGALGAFLGYRRHRQARATAQSA